MTPAELAGRFTELTGRAPAGVWSAPGRATVIGEHLDYNGGRVLPFALPLRTAAAAVARTDDVVRCWALQEGDMQECVVGDDPPQVQGWAAYVFGTVWAMRPLLREGGAPELGLDLVVDGDVPLGGGLSSSAALECAVALAVDGLSEAGLDRLALAQAGQRAEHEVVGAPVGLMDQAAAMFGEQGCAVLLDCATLDHTSVRLPLERTGTTLLVIDTHVSHDLAAGQYAARRDECEQAAAALGVEWLAGATLAQVDAAGLDDTLARRARHVVTEQARVDDVVTLLEREDMAAVGALLTAGHVSLREDFEVSTPELDSTVDAALEAGALGARLTGGGFGGCVVVLTPSARVDDILSRVLSVAVGEDRPEPSGYDGTPSVGARRDR